MTSDSNAMLIQSASCDQNITAETKNNTKINDYRDVKDQVWNLQNQSQPQMILENFFHKLRFKLKCVRVMDGDRQC